MIQDGGGSGGTAGEVINKLGGIGGTVADLGNQNLKIKVQTGTVDTFAGSIRDGGVAGGTGGSLTLGGLGELSLTHANTYTGGTTLDAGTLDLAASGAAGSGTITFANPASNGVATLEIDAAALSGSGGSYSFGNKIAGATSANQVIDLTSLAYVQGSTNATLSGTSLSVTNGSSTVGLTLAATQSKSSFTTASDGHGGTLVYDPPGDDQARAGDGKDRQELDRAGHGGVRRRRRRRACASLDARSVRPRHDLAVRAAPWPRRQVLARGVTGRRPTGSQSQARSLLL